MSDELNLFEKALDDSFAKDIKQATKAMYQVYSELINAGFDKESALKIMLSLLTPIKR